MEGKNVNKSRLIIRISRSEIMTFVIAALLMLATLCSRPMLLGNNYAPVGLVIMVAISGLILYKKRFRFAVNKKHNFKTLAVALIFFAYCLIQGVLLKSDRLRNGIFDIIYLVVSVLTFYLCFLYDNLKRKYIKLLYVILAVFVMTYAVSFLLALFVGWESLHIGDWEYGYFVKAQFYFPFTLTYGRYTFNGISVWRMLGIARECGISQIYYVWAFFMADKYFQKPSLIKCIMALGVCACMSTAGFIVFGVALLFSFESKKIVSWKTVISIGLIIVMIYVLFYSSGLSIADKNQISILDRQDAIFRGFQDFVERPIFGHGYNDTLGLGENSQIGINAISSLGQIGLFGVILWLSIFAVNMLQYKKKKRWLMANVAYMATAMFSQPLMFAPITYWFFFVDYTDEDKTERLVKIGRG